MISFLKVINPPARYAKNLNECMPTTMNPTATVLTKNQRERRGIISSERKNNNTIPEKTNVAPPIQKLFTAGSTGSTVCRPCHRIKPSCAAAKNAIPNVIHIHGGKEKNAAVSGNPSTAYPERRKTPTPTHCRRSNGCPKKIQSTNTPGI